MKRRTFLQNTGALGLATIITPFGLLHPKQTSSVADTLESGFMLPPSSAKPHTWWHWMNGNVTKEGITLDLESMARVGIGGVQNFDAGTGIPKGPVVYLTPEWLELKKHAINEAQRLGLEFTMHNCPGWSSSGGPWITPELAMQEVTWSEIVIAGEKQVDIKLPQPLTRLNYYKDFAVIAYKSLPGEKPLESIAKSITTNKGAVDVNKVTIERDGYLQFEFNAPVDIQQVSFITAAYDDQRGPIVLASSDDGVAFRTVATFNTGSAFNEPRGEVSFSQNIPQTKFKFLRFTCNHIRQFTQIRFSNTPRVAEWQKRANFAFNREGVANVEGGIAIPSEDIIDVSQSFGADGSFKWSAPKGDWTILRFGYTPNGTMNRSAPDTGVGLECDKFSAQAIEFHFNKMMEQLLPTLKKITENGKAGLLIDSYEVGMQNWTNGFENEFFKANQYSIIKLLPALTGRLVGNADNTDRFLWDYRRTQGDLMANNYYGKFTELCHNNKMISYCQPYDRGPMEEMQIGSRVDTNVGEFWNGLSAIFQNNWTMRRTVKLSAAIAHTNGQKIVAAESFTGEPGSSKWQEHPFGLKALGDRMFTQGLNRMVFHRFAHQPHPTAAPGMTMGPWGSHFDRTNTWWEQGKAWMQYLTRCQYMLQAGTFVADLVYFTGEDAGVYTRVERNELKPEPPEGYDYDLINSEALLNRAKVVDKKLTLPDGTNYSILVLQDFQIRRPKLAEKIQQFVNEGLTVVGADRPIKEVLKELNIQPDFSFTSFSGDAPITYIHRRTGDADIYFIANQRRSTEPLKLEFRSNGREPEFWDPVSGTISRLSNAGTTLPEYGSAFIVFRKPARNPVANPSTPFKTERQTFPNVKNSFSIIFWAKPESNIMLSTNNFMDGQKPWTDYYAIYPSPGEKLYGPGHATCGIAVGRNGVAVWEHANGKPVFSFSAAKEISAWAQIVLVYKDGVPSVFVNKELVQTGPKSTFIMHPGLGHVFLSEGASFYNGDMDMDSLELREVAIGQEGISALPSERFPGLQAIEPLPLLNISNDWKVAFPGKSGAPSSAVLVKLLPLNQHNEVGIKYFSGTCTYTKSFSFKMPAKIKDQPLLLDLGSVEVIAEVILNKKSLGIFWARPFVIDVTDTLVNGSNELVIKVTTLWPNRLIGDEQANEPYKYSPAGGAGFAALSSGGITELPEWYQKNLPKPDDGRVAFTTWKHYVKNSPLLESGLIGPVVIRRGTVISG